MSDLQSEPVRNFAINAGPGDLYQAENQHNYQGLKLTSHPMPVDFLQASRDAFATVDKIDEARKALEDSPLIVLMGDHHTGRRTAAAHLLQDVPSPASTPTQFSRARPVHEFTLDWPSPDTRFLSLAQGVDHVLDLSDEDEKIKSGFIRALA